ncbi:UvrB/UvrC motif-containing protein [Geminisphaera colitermitum]|uniref:UvrB/UvrC motif-containing protein n=1 Tax=Geminisphaera colitermitum TaxID=1148786 RepID=UPI0001965274|nr:UvrB/UvrC motif-containing protein [Geminisphaera colitermitum]
MASNIQCDLCGKPATVHLTQILNNKVHKVDLCEACAQAKGVTDPSGFSLSDLLSKAALLPEVASAAASSALRCKACGFSEADFKKHGRFGCPQCYATFKDIVTPMLDNMHKGTTHTGKVPVRALTRKSLYERLTELETNLSEAVKTERYEDAARFRDEIIQLKSTQQAAAEPELALDLTESGTKSRKSGTIGKTSQSNPPAS